MYNGVPNFSTLLATICQCSLYPMVSSTCVITAVYRSHEKAVSRANFLGASATTFPGQDIGCTSHGGESYGFSIVSRGCFDLVDGRC